MNETKWFVPVVGERGTCAGHLMRGAKGWRVFDREDHEIGTFADFAEGTKALLNSQTMEI
jgi:hypothetical protein